MTEFVLTPKEKKPEDTRSQAMTPVNQGLSAMEYVDYIPYMSENGKKQMARVVKRLDGDDMLRDGILSSVPDALVAYNTPSPELNFENTSVMNNKREILAWFKTQPDNIRKGAGKLLKRMEDADINADPLDDSYSEVGTIRDKLGDYEDFSTYAEEHKPAYGKLLQLRSARRYLTEQKYDEIERRTGINPRPIKVTKKDYDGIYATALKDQIMPHLEYLNDELRIKKGHEQFIHDAIGHSIEMMANLDRHTSTQGTDPLFGGLMNIISQGKRALETDVLEGGQLTPSAGQTILGGLLNTAELIPGLVVGVEGLYNKLFRDSSEDVTSTQTSSVARTISALYKRQLETGKGITKADLDKDTEDYAFTGAMNTVESLARQGFGYALGGIVAKTAQNVPVPWIKAAGYGLGAVIAFSGLAGTGAAEKASPFPFDISDLPGLSGLKGVTDTYSLQPKIIEGLRTMIPLHSQAELDAVRNSDLSIEAKQHILDIQKFREAMDEPNLMERLMPELGTIVGDIAGLAIGGKKIPILGGAFRGHHYAKSMANEMKKIYGYTPYDNIFLKKISGWKDLDKEANAIQKSLSMMKRGFGTGADWLNRNRAKYLEAFATNDPKNLRGDSRLAWLMNRGFSIGFDGMMTWGLAEMLKNPDATTAEIQAMAFQGTLFGYAAAGTHYALKSLASRMSMNRAAKLGGIALSDGSTLNDLMGIKKGEEILFKHIQSKGEAATIKALKAGADGLMFAGISALNGAIDYGWEGVVDYFSSADNITKDFLTGMLLSLNPSIGGLKGLSEVKYQSDFIKKGIADLDAMHMLDKKNLEMFVANKARSKPKTETFKASDEIKNKATEKEKAHDITEQDIINSRMAAEGASEVKPKSVEEAETGVPDMVRKNIRDLAKKMENNEPWSDRYTYDNYTKEIEQERELIRNEREAYDESLVNSDFNDEAFSKGEPIEPIDYKEVFDKLPLSDKEYSLHRMLLLNDFSKRLGVEFDKVLFQDSTIDAVDSFGKKYDMYGRYFNDVMNVSTAYTDADIETIRRNPAAADTLFTDVLVKRIAHEFTHSKEDTTDPDILNKRIVALDILRQLHPEVYERELSKAREMLGESASPEDVSKYADNEMLALGGEQWANKLLGQVYRDMYVGDNNSLFDKIRDIYTDGLAKVVKLFKSNKPLTNTEDHENRRKIYQEMLYYDELKELKSSRAKEAAYSQSESLIQMQDKINSEKLVDMLDKVSAAHSEKYHKFGLENASTNQFFQSYFSDIAKNADEIIDLMYTKWDSYDKMVRDMEDVLVSREKAGLENPWSRTEEGLKDKKNYFNNFWYANHAGNYVPTDAISITAVVDQRKVSVNIKHGTNGEPIYAGVPTFNEKGNTVTILGERINATKYMRKLVGLDNFMQDGIDSLKGSFAKVGLLNPFLDMLFEQVKNSPIGRVQKTGILKKGEIVREGEKQMFYDADGEFKSYEGIKRFSKITVLDGKIVEEKDGLKAQGAGKKVDSYFQEDKNGVYYLEPPANRFDPLLFAKNPDSFLTQAFATGNYPLPMGDKSAVMLNMAETVLKMLTEPFDIINQAGETSTINIARINQGTKALMMCSSPPETDLYDKYSYLAELEKEYLRAMFMSNAAVGVGKEKSPYPFTRSEQESLMFSVPSNEDSQVFKTYNVMNYVDFVSNKDGTASCIKKFTPNDLVSLPKLVKDKIGATFNRLEPSLNRILNRAMEGNEYLFNHNMAEFIKKRAKIKNVDYSGKEYITIFDILNTDRDPRYNDIKFPLETLSYIKRDFNRNSTEDVKDVTDMVTQDIDVALRGKLIQSIDHLFYLGVDPSFKHFFNQIDGKEAKDLEKYTPTLYSRDITPPKVSDLSLMLGRDLIKDPPIGFETDGKELFLRAYHFNPKDWNVANFEKFGITIPDKEKALVEQAIKEFLDIIGEKSIDAATITLDTDYLAEKEQRPYETTKQWYDLLQLHETGTPTKNLFAQNNGLMIKHSTSAFRTDWQAIKNLAESMPNERLGQKVLHLLMAGLRANNVGMIVFDSAIKGGNTYRYNEKQVGKELFALNNKNELEGRIDYTGEREGKSISASEDKGKSGVPDAKGEVKFKSKEKEEGQEESKPLPTGSLIFPFGANIHEEFVGMLGEAGINAGRTSPLSGLLSGNSGKDMLDIENRLLKLAMTGKEGLYPMQQKYDATHTDRSSGLTKLFTYQSQVLKTSGEKAEILRSIANITGAEDSAFNIIMRRVEQQSKQLAGSLDAYNKLTKLFLDRFTNRDTRELEPLGKVKNDNFGRIIDSLDSTDKQALKDLLITTYEYVSKRMKDNATDLSVGFDNTNTGLKQVAEDYAPLSKNALKTLDKIISYNKKTKDYEVNYDNLPLLMNGNDIFYVNPMIDPKMSLATLGKGSVFVRMLKMQIESIWRQWGTGGMPILVPNFDSIGDINRGMRSKYFDEGAIRNDAMLMGMIMKDYNVKNDPYESILNFFQAQSDKSGVLKDGSLGVIVSEDILKARDWRIGQRIMSILTPSDAVTSTVPLVIVGMLPKGHANSMTFSSKLMLEILGRDMDIDTMGIMGYDKTWEIEKLDGSNTVNGFDLLHQVMLDNKAYTGDYKSEVVKIREDLKQGMSIEDVTKKYPDFSNSMDVADTKIPAIGMASTFDRRQFFGNKTIGKSDFFGKQVIRLAQQMVEPTPVTMDISDYQVKFKFGFDEKKFNLLHPFIKEQSVDIFNKKFLKEDFDRWISNMLVSDITFTKNGIKQEFKDLGEVKRKLKAPEINNFTERALIAIEAYTSAAMRALGAEGDVGKFIKQEGDLSIANLYDKVSAYRLSTVDKTLPQAYSEVSKKNKFSGIVQSEYKKGLTKSRTLPLKLTTSDSPLKSTNVFDVDTLMTKILQRPLGALPVDANKMMYESLKTASELLSYYNLTHHADGIHSSRFETLFKWQSGGGKIVGDLISVLDMASGLVNRIKAALPTDTLTTAHHFNWVYNFFEPPSNLPFPEGNELVKFSMPNLQQHEKNNLRRALVISYFNAMIAGDGGRETGILYKKDYREEISGDVYSYKYTEQRPLVLSFIQRITGDEEVGNKVNIITSTKTPVEDWAGNRMGYIGNGVAIHVKFETFMKDSGGGSFTPMIRAKVLDGMNSVEKSVSEAIPIDKLFKGGIETRFVDKSIYDVLNTLAKSESGSEVEQLKDGNFDNYVTLLAESLIRGGEYNAQTIKDYEGKTKDTSGLTAQEKLTAKFLNQSEGRLHIVGSVPGTVSQKRALIENIFSKIVVGMSEIISNRPASNIGLSPRDAITRQYKTLLENSDISKDDAAMNSFREAIMDSSLSNNEFARRVIAPLMAGIVLTERSPAFSYARAMKNSNTRPETGSKLEKLEAELLHSMSVHNIEMDIKKLIGDSEGREREMAEIISVVGGEYESNLLHTTMPIFTSTGQKIESLLEKDGVRALMFDRETKRLTTPFDVGNEMLKEASLLYAPSGVYSSGERLDSGSLVHLSKIKSTQDVLTGFSKLGAEVLIKTNQHTEEFYNKLNAYLGKQGADYKATDILNPEKLKDDDTRRSLFKHYRDFLVTELANMADIPPGEKPEIEKMLREKNSISSALIESINRLFPESIGILEDGLMKKGISEFDKENDASYKELAPVMNSLAMSAYRIFNDVRNYNQSLKKFNRQVKDYGHAEAFVDNIRGLMIMEASPFSAATPLDAMMNYGKQTEIMGGTDIIFSTQLSDGAMLMVTPTNLSYLPSVLTSVQSTKVSLAAKMFGIAQTLSRVSSDWSLKIGSMMREMSGYLASAETSGIDMEKVKEASKLIIKNFDRIVIKGNLEWHDERIANSETRQSKNDDRPEDMAAAQADYLSSLSFVKVEGETAVRFLYDTEFERNKETIAKFKGEGWNSIVSMIEEKITNNDTLKTDLRSIDSTLLKNGIEHALIEKLMLQQVSDVCTNRANSLASILKQGYALGARGEFAAVERFVRKLRNHAKLTNLVDIDNPTDMINALKYSPQYQMESKHAQIKNIDYTLSHLNLVLKGEVPGHLPSLTRRERFALEQIIGERSDAKDIDLLRNAQIAVEKMASEVEDNTKRNRLDEYTKVHSPNTELSSYYEDKILDVLHRSKTLIGTYSEDSLSKYKLGLEREFEVALAEALKSYYSISSADYSRRTGIDEVSPVMNELYGALNELSGGLMGFNKMANFTTKGIDVKIGNLIAVEYSLLPNDKKSIAEDTKEALYEVYGSGSVMTEYMSKQHVDNLVNARSPEESATYAKQAEDYNELLTLAGQRPKRRNTEWEMSMASRLSFKGMSFNKRIEGYYAGTTTLKGTEYAIIYSPSFKSGFQYIEMNKVKKVLAGYSHDIISKKARNTMSSVLRKFATSDNIAEIYDAIEAANKPLDLKYVNGKYTYTGKEEKTENKKKVSEFNKSIQSAYREEHIKNLGAHMSYASHMIKRWTPLIGYYGLGKIAKSALGIAGGVAATLGGVVNPAFLPLAGAMFSFAGLNLVGYVSKVTRNTMQNYGSAAITTYGYANSLRAGYKEIVEFTRNMFNTDNKRARQDQYMSQFTKFSDDVVGINRTMTQKTSDIKRDIGLISELNKRMDIAIKEAPNASMLQRDKGLINEVEMLKTDYLNESMTLKKRVGLAVEVLQELEKDLEGGDRDMLKTLKSMQYVPRLNKFMDKHGNDIAALIDLKKRLQKEMLSGLLTGGGGLLLGSEEATRQMAQRMSINTLLGKDFDAHYDKEDIQHIVKNMENTALGAFGKLEKTQFQRSTFGGLMTLYSKFGKLNANYYLHRIGRSVDEQMFLHLLSKDPDLKDYYSLDKDGILVYGGGKEGIGKQLNVVEDFRKKMNVGISVGLASGMASMALKSLVAIIGASYMKGALVSLLGLDDDSDKYLNLGGSYRDISSGSLKLVAFMAGGIGVDYLENKAGIIKGKTSPAEFEKYWTEALNSPTEFLYGIGAGKGFSSWLGGATGLGLNFLGYTLRDKGSNDKFHLAMDNASKKAWAQYINSIITGTPILGAGYETIKPVTDVVTTAVRADKKTKEGKKPKVTSEQTLTEREIFGVDY
jgi:hypothetical protein